MPLLWLLQRREETKPGTREKEKEIKEREKEIKEREKEIKEREKERTRVARAGGPMTGAGHLGGEVCLATKAGGWKGHWRSGAAQ